MIVETIIGWIIAIPISLAVFIRFVLSGFKLQAKARTTPPKALQDKSYGQHKYVSVNGVRLHYVESGDVTKPLILFVHGFPEFWYSWRHQIKYFQKNYHVIAFDMRGYGDSDKPAGINNYTVPLLVEDIRALVVAVGKENFHLVAHDWGGVVAWTFAALHPQMVKSYTSCNIPHPLALHEARQKTVKQKLMSWYTLFFQAPVIPELFVLGNDIDMFDNIMKEGHMQQDTELVEAYKYTFRDFTSWNRTINYYRAVVRNRASTPFKQLKDIQVPVQQIFGTADKYLSVEAAQGSAKFCRNHKLELLTGISHWVQQEAHEAVNKHIEAFIKINP